MSVIYFIIEIVQKLVFPVRLWSCHDNIGIRDAPKEILRDYLGIFPKGGGGVFLSVKY